MKGLRTTALAVAAGLVLSGCTTAIAGEPTAAPGASSTPSSTRVHVNFGPQVDPPPSGPIRLLPEIVTPVNGATR